MACFKLGSAGIFEELSVNLLLGAWLKLGWFEGGFGRDYSFS